jgi:alkanesulfonate monooxygenase SsuD/methylene tetrahydromethanopterin reductase-like flavin-dependent oxidoreductase (luciferase family)
MKYGFVMPFGDARAAADLAWEAEQAGWDGFFVYEPVWGVDAWVCLTAAAMRTTRIRLGTMLSPLSRMRPWDLAGKAATLDRLSNGRLTLSVGLGAVDTGFGEFGEETDVVKRAELVDEGLDILFGLWQGQPFEYAGKHYRLHETKFTPAPAPVQQPRIPVWMVGLWPKMKSMRRVLRCDGLLPSAKDAEGKTVQASPADVREMRDWIASQRQDGGSFEIVVEGKTPGQDRKRAREIVASWSNAGATWWIEALWDVPADRQDLLLQRIRQGPPEEETSG